MCVVFFIGDSSARLAKVVFKLCRACTLNCYSYKRRTAWTGWTRLDRGGPEAPCEEARRRSARRRPRGGAEVMSMYMYVHSAQIAP